MPAPPVPDRPTFYRQEQPNTCAVACLRMVLSAFKVNLSEADLAQRAKTDAFGTHLANLVQAAVDLGFDCEAKVLDFATLKGSLYPIVYLDGPTLGRSFLMHAVVVEETDATIRVLDPSVGEIDMRVTLFCDAWDLAGNYAVLVNAKAP